MKSNLIVAIVGLVYSWAAFAQVKGELREVSRAEIEAMKNVASAGRYTISVSGGIKVVDRTGGEHKLIVAPRATYKMAANQPPECSNKKLLKLESGDQYINDEGKLVARDQVTEVTETAQELEVPLQTYLRIVTKDFFRPKEKFCFFELEKAGLAMALDSASMLRSMWTSSLPMKESELDGTESAVQVNLGVSSGQHGTYPKCASDSCVIPVSKTAGSSLILNYSKE